MVFSHFFAEAHFALPVMYKEMKELFATLNSQRQLNARYHYQWIVFSLNAEGNFLIKLLNPFFNLVQNFPEVISAIRHPLYYSGFEVLILSLCNVSSNRLKSTFCRGFILYSLFASKHLV